jgi:hypothetical protein
MRLPKADFERGGFARAVGANDAKALACVDVERKVINDLVCAVGFDEMLSLKYHVNLFVIDFIQRRTLQMRAIAPAD